MHLYRMRSILRNEKQQHKCVFIRMDTSKAFAIWVAGNWVPIDINRPVSWNEFYCHDTASKAIVSLSLHITCRSIAMWQVIDWTIFVCVVCCICMYLLPTIFIAFQIKSLWVRHFHRVTIHIKQQSTFAADTELPIVYSAQFACCTHKISNIPTLIFSLLSPTKKFSKHEINIDIYLYISHSDVQK